MMRVRERGDQGAEGWEEGRGRGGGSAGGREGGELTEGRRACEQVASIFSDAMFAELKEEMAEHGFSGLVRAHTLDASPLDAGCVNG